MKAVRCHVQEKWLLLYIERWLAAPGVEKTGERIERRCGTPQGGVISPLLANLFLHYVFDLWMRKEFETVPFERYADDIIVHCRSKKQARYVMEVIRQRLASCGLTMHPQKTKIVYFKDDQRSDNHDHTNFTFLGYQFRARLARNSQTGQFFVGFIPAVSSQAMQSMRRVIRSWNLKSCVPMTLEEVAMQINPVVRGWINYYGRYCESALRPVLHQVEIALSGWVMRKFKKLHRRRVESLRWLARARIASPNPFAHWTAAEVND